MRFLNEDPGTPLGKVRVHGAEIIFDYKSDHRGRLWMPVEAQTNLIYGKNGAGKSTIIRALNSAFSGDSQPNDTNQVRLFIEIADELPVDVTESDDLDEDVEFDEQEDHDEEDGSEELENEELGHILEEFFSPAGRADLVAELSKSYWFSEGFQFLSFEDFQIVQAEFCPSHLQLTEDQFLSDSWGIQTKVSLRAARAAWLTWLLIDGETMWEGESDRPNRNLVVNAFKELVGQDYYCLTPLGDGQFNLSIAGRISREFPNINSLNLSFSEAIKSDREEFHSKYSTQDDKQLLSELVDEQYLALSDESEWLNSVGPTSALIDYDMSATQFAGIPSNSPFLRFASWNGFVKLNTEHIWGRSNAPKFINLNVLFEIDTWFKFKLHYAFGYEESWTFAITSDPNSDAREFSPRYTVSSHFESDDLSNLRILVNKIGETLQQFDIGIGGLRLNLSSRPSKWMDGSGAELEIMDAATGSWVDYKKISPAQQSILSMVIQIADAKENGAAVIVFGDEIDAGLHVSAIRMLYRYIDKETTMSYLATHSPTALSLPSLGRLHISRGYKGRIFAQPWVPSENFRDDAQVLGVDRIHLFSVATGLIFVEGPHDKAAINVLLEAGWPDKHPNFFVIVVPTMGHTNMAALAESFLLTQITEVPIIAITDSANSERLSDIHKKACELAQIGTKPGRIISDLQIMQKLTTASPEEKSLLNLLIFSINNGSVERIKPIGMSKPDIINYLDPINLGLDSSWESLWTEFKSGARSMNFKSWLIKEKNATISERSIKEAFRNLDTYHKDLSDLIQIIATTCSPN